MTEAALRAGDELIIKACAAELAEFFYPANPPYRSKEAMAQDMTLVLARHFRAALTAFAAAHGREVREQLCRLIETQFGYRANCQEIAAAIRASEAEQAGG